MLFVISIYTNINLYFCDRKLVFGSIWNFHFYWKRMCVCVCVCEIPSIAQKFPISVRQKSVFRIFVNFVAA